MKVIHAALQDHLDTGQTTTCRILKIKSAAGTVFGLATLETDVEYDDGSGDGLVTYSATRGFDASAFRSDVGGSVDNAEGMVLLSANIEGITLEMVDAGELDDAQWVCYLVNYKDLTAGRHAIIGSGDLGEVTTRHGMVWIPELLDLSVRLKQPVGVSTSRKCRATFGNPATEDFGQTGCGIDVSGMWSAGEVQSAGTETNRVFTGDAVASPHSFPGRVRFTTGSNTGRVFAVEAVTGFVIELVETTPYPIEAGDLYEIRPDCGKRFVEDCITIWDNGPNFKGGPHMPDGSEVAAPR